MMNIVTTCDKIRHQLTLNSEISEIHFCLNFESQINHGKSLAEKVSSGHWSFETKIDRAMFSDNAIRYCQYLRFPKTIFSCHICGKKTEFRRASEKHINANHKIKCAVVGCPKLFWKPTANNEHRYRQAIIRHHHAKHFCSD